MPRLYSALRKLTSRSARGHRREMRMTNRSGERRSEPDRKRSGMVTAIADVMVADAPPHQHRVAILGLVEMKGRPSVRRGEIPGQRVNLGISKPVDPQSRRPRRRASERPGTYGGQEVLPQHLLECPLVLSGQLTKIIAERIRRAVLHWPCSSPAASSARSARRDSSSSKVRNRPAARSSSASRSAAW